MTDNILFVAPNSYVLRNWIASGLVDMCQDELNLLPLFVTHFSDPTFESPLGRQYTNCHVSTTVNKDKEIPAGFSRLLYLIYYLRLRTSAQEIVNGSIRMMMLARRRDIAHYFIRTVRFLLPRGSAQRYLGRALLDSINPVNMCCARIIREAKPICVVVGSPGFLFLDQLMLIEAKRLGIPTHCIVNSWDNMTSRGAMIRRPDTLMVWNEHMRTQAAEIHQYPRAKVYVTGSLQFSQYVGEVTAEESGRLFRRIGLTPGSSYLLFLTGQHVPEYEAEDVAVLLRTLETSQYANWPVVVRIHPEACDAPFKELKHRNLVLDCPPKYAAKGNNGFRFDVSQMRGMAALLKNASIVFSSWATTALLEAAIFDKPIVQLRWMDAFSRAQPQQALMVHDFQKYLHLKPFDVIGCRIFCDSPHILRSDIQRLFDEEELFRAKRRLAVEGFAYPPLKAAAQRAVDVLRRELARRGKNLRIR